ncbi:glycosyltransferase family 2 protein [Paenibacillus sp. FSL K6-3166]|uniref:glycosyltransferase family 2 protein n=1 Tax=unclassified Paenibacillus TaxID=185978 RepID=UPI000BA18A40|nr:glycosyltransferase family 2 protein [Paenibacillus sp. VTT E-133291]OZQ83597.1 hypothetical protein CA598_24240 [Paenibacillus sp. VTT E-133291]
MISVIIPLYNVEKYIEFCLQSFEYQIEREFEIIVIDDGSTDNSAAIVNEYIKQSSLKIRLINQVNSGVSAARNKGINESQGNYICFVDSDDMVAPEYLSELRRMLNEYGSDLAFCGFKKVPENYSVKRYKDYYNDKFHETVTSYEALRKYLYHEFVSGACTLLVKKELIERNKLRFSEGYRYSEDLEMVWKLISYSKSVSINKNELYIYRTRQGSAMSFVDERRTDGFQLMKRLEGHFKNNRPDFSREFINFGIARWVWATLWQNAIASENYRIFSESAEQYNSKTYMRKLLKFPDFKITITSLIYCIFPIIYYLIVNKIGIKLLDRRNG